MCQLNLAKRRKILDKRKWDGSKVDKQNFTKQFCEVSSFRGREY